MSDVPPDLKSALIGRYSLEGVVGHGGMATVYLARDERHARQVAVKVLRPEISAAIGTERFLREIEIAAQLNHPHILTLIDSGEAAGFLYYVMPYVEGETLRGRLLREKRLELGAAVPIVAETADALDYAHRRGVVHRDIKPENILLSEGHAVVADFGIAKAVVSAGGAGLTRSGFPLGTPGYMSPEQAVGRTDLDARTDVYSLACVAYEMVVGETPGMWLPDEVVRLGRFAEAEPEHRDRLDRLPGRLEQALVGALAMSPGLRYATPGEFAAAFEEGLRGGPRVGDAEARGLVQRAAALEAERPTAGQTYSIGGVERLAAEAGIPPEHVREAALQVSSETGRLKRGGILLVSPKLEFEHFVPGTISERQHAALLEEIRVTLGEIGQLNETLSESLSWSSKPQGHRTQVLVSSRGDSTRIHIADDDAAPKLVVMAPVSLVSFVMFGVTGAIAEGMGASTGTAMAVAIGVGSGLFTTGWLASRAWFHRVMQRRHATLSRLVLRLGQIVTGADRLPPGPE
jgi:hypothetical protein